MLGMTEVKLSGAIRSLPILSIFLINRHQGPSWLLPKCSIIAASCWSCGGEVTAADNSHNGIFFIVRMHGRNAWHSQPIYQYSVTVTTALHSGTGTLAAPLFIE